MIAFVSAWIKDIILVVLFAAFMELLLPSSSMQRFIRVIMGLFIMLTILNPALDVIQNHLASGQELSAVTTALNNSVSSKNVTNSMSDERDKLAY
ncbi:MAG: stage III sporulation protein AF, partial [Negativicutes bacterium]